MARGFVNTVAPHTHKSEEIAVGKAFTISLSAEGWTEEDPISQRVENANFKPEEQGWSYIVGAYPNANDYDTINKAMWVGIMQGGIEDGAATFTCGLKPTAKIRLNILRIRTESE